MALFKVAQNANCNREQNEYAGTAKAGWLYRGQMSYLLQNQQCESNTSIRQFTTQLGTHNELENTDN